MSGEPQSAGVLLADTLDRTLRDEQRRALRGLLANPLMLASHPLFPLVRRHADALRTWLGRETGWQLRVEPDFARLQKYPVEHSDAYRAARLGKRPGDLPFSRRRYALLCLALAELSRGEGQTTLGRIGQSLMQAASDPALAATGLHFSLEGREQRKDLVAVVRLLLEYGVLKRVAGAEEAYIQSGEQDVLYDVHRRALATLLICSRGPSLVEIEDQAAATPMARMTAISERFLPESPEAKMRVLRQRLTARLLDDPVLYWDELNEDERQYLKSQRKLITQRIEEATGLLTEARAEGVAMVDADGDLSDTRLPAEGTEGHATLLLAQYLADHAKRNKDPLPRRALEKKMQAWAEQYAKYWRKATREPGAEAALCDGALQRLAALRLIELQGEQVRPLAPIGRYQLNEPSVVTPKKRRK